MSDRKHCVDEFHFFMVTLCGVILLIFTFIIFVLRCYE